MKYTDKLIKEAKDYLNLSVKKGYLSEESAQDLIRTENWEEVIHLMDEGDHFKDEN